MYKNKLLLITITLLLLITTTSSEPSITHVLSDWTLLPEWREELDLTTEESLAITTETALIEEAIALELWLKKEPQPLKTLKDLGLRLNNPINHLPLKNGERVGEFSIEKETDHFYIIWNLRPRKGVKRTLLVRLRTDYILKKLKETKAVFQKYHLFFGEEEAKGEITFGIVCDVLNCLALHKLRITNQTHLFKVFPFLKDMKNVYQKTETFWKNQPGSATISSKIQNGETKITVKYNYPYRLPDGSFGYTEAYFYFRGEWRKAWRFDFIP